MSTSPSGFKPASGNFARIPHEVWEDARLSATDVRVMLAILKTARQAVECRPSNKDLADTAHVSRRTVQRSLESLERAAYIRVTGGDKEDRVVALASIFSGPKARPHPMTLVSPPHDTGVAPPRHPCHPPMTLVSPPHDTGVAPPTPPIEERTRVPEEELVRTIQEPDGVVGGVGSGSTLRRDREPKSLPPGVPERPESFRAVCTRAKRLFKPDSPDFNANFPRQLWEAWCESHKLRAGWEAWGEAHFRGGLVKLATTCPPDKQHVGYFLGMLARAWERGERFTAPPEPKPGSRRRPEEILYVRGVPVDDAGRPMEGDLPPEPSGPPRRTLPIDFSKPPHIWQRELALFRQRLEAAEASA